MPSKFGTADHWRQRAAEARELAEQMSDAIAKRSMLKVANNYEKIADRVTAAGKGPPSLSR